MNLTNCSKYNQIEKTLLISFSAKLSKLRKISLVESEKIITPMLDYAIKESKKDKTYYLTEKLGDILIGRTKSKNIFVEKIIKQINSGLKLKRSEGVNDDDIRFWWNKNDIERRMIILFDDLNILIMNEFEKNKTKSIEIANEIIWKKNPIFGENNNKKNREYKPLPYELRSRVYNFLNKKLEFTKRKIINDIFKNSSFVSFNSYLRDEIKKGHI